MVQKEEKMGYVLGVESFGEEVLECGRQSTLVYSVVISG